MFISSSIKRNLFFELITFEKEELFHIENSSKISNLYIKNKHKNLLDNKLTVIIKDENLIIINIKAKLSEFNDGNNPVVNNINAIFRKTKSVSISIKVEIDNIDNILVNEFLIETEDVKTKK